MGRQRNLNASLQHRFAELTRPRWARTTLARQVAAGVLAVLALALFVRGDPDRAATTAVVLRHDLPPGHVLTADDVELVSLPARALPDGVLRDTSDATGHTLAGPRHAGEILTDTAVLGPRLTAAAAEIADARVVPVRLADARVAELLREGDRVDVLTATADDRTTLATDAAVILVSLADTGRAADDPVVLLALPDADAKAVAGASLTQALAVVLR